MFKLNQLNIKHKETVAPIETVSFLATGGREIEIMVLGSSIEIQFSDPVKTALAASFKKADLAEYIKLLTVLHDQLK